MSDPSPARDAEEQTAQPIRSPTTKRLVAGTLVLAATFAAGVGLTRAWMGNDGPTPAQPNSSEEIDPVAPIEIYVVEVGSLNSTVEATGHLAAWQSVDVAASASGIVRAVGPDEGGAVRRGGMLIRLDDRVQRLAIQEAETGLEAARAAYAALAVGDSLLDVYRRRAVTRGLTDTASVVNTRQDAVRRATSGVAAAEQLRDRARMGLQQMVVTAPISGSVMDRAVEEGEYVSEGQTVFTLLDTSRLRVEVDVLEADIPNLRRGASARVWVPSVGGPFDGRVLAVLPSLDPETGAGKVVLVLDRAFARLKPGMFARAEINIGTAPDQILVPEAAILERQGRSVVFRIQAGRALWTYVDARLPEDGWVALGDGVAAGDSVAVAGHFVLAHDAPVVITSVLTREQGGAPRGAGER